MTAVEPLRHVGNSSNIDWYDPADAAARERPPYLAVEVHRSDHDHAGRRTWLRANPVYLLTVRRFTARGNREVARVSYVADPPVPTGTVLDPDLVREIANKALADLP